MHGTGQQNNMNDLFIAAWLRAQYLPIEGNEYAEVSWAVNELFDLAHDAPDKLLPLVIEILKVDASKTVIGALGAGVLEELLIFHGDEYVDKLAELCESNKNLEECSKLIHLDMNDVSPAVFKRYLDLKL
jgi:hypothetical protein